MKRHMIGIVGLALSLCLTVVSAEAKTLKVVASFTILADIVRNVGGTEIEVTSLVGPNGDPHTFEPTPDDARALTNADLVVVNGLGLEGWMERLISASGYKGKPVVASDGIVTLRMDEDGKTVIDPHAWNSAKNGITYARNIATALAKADPDDARAFEANAAAYAQKLAALDDQARREVANLPAAQRKILTTHDALGYFAKAYGVQILSPLGISTEQEPSAAAMAKLIEQIRREKIRTYFLENSNDPRLIEQIARATGAQPGGELFVESLSKPNGPAATYLAMFQYNLALVVKAMHAQV